MPGFFGRVSKIIQVYDIDWSGYVVIIYCSDPPDTTINVIAPSIGVFETAFLHELPVRLTAYPIGEKEVSQFVPENVECNTFLLI